MNPGKTQSRHSERSVDRFLSARFLRGEPLFDENPQLLFYEEGIALAFFADGGGETVAGIDDGVVWQCEEFMDQRVHHFFHGAAP
jgi:hypothetical protein